MLKNRANEKISHVQESSMDEAIRLEDMIAVYRMNMVKNPNVNKFDDAAVEIAMIPIYEVVITC